MTCYNVAIETPISALIMQSASRQMLVFVFDDEVKLYCSLSRNARNARFSRALAPAKLGIGCAQQ